MPLHCRPVVRLAKKVIKENQFDLIVLVSRYERSKDLHEVKKAVKAWMEISKSDIILLGARAEFPRLKNQLIHKARWPIDRDPSITFERSQRTDDYFDMNNLKNVNYISSKTTFCAINNCDYKNRDDVRLHTDYGHFTRTGAKDFMEVLTGNICNETQYKFCEILKH